MTGKHVYKNRPVVAVDKATMKVVKRYASYKRAARDIGVEAGVMRRHILRKSLFEDFTAFRFEDEYDENETFEPFTKNRPVVRRRAGKEELFANTLDAAEASGIKRKDVLQAICYETPVHGFWFRYAR